MILNKSIFQINMRRVMFGLKTLLKKKERSIFLANLAPYIVIDTRNKILTMKLTFYLT